MRSKNRRRIARYTSRFTLSVNCPKKAYSRCTARLRPTRGIALHLRKVRYFPHGIANAIVAVVANRVILRARYHGPRLGYCGLTGHTAGLHRTTCSKLTAPSEVAWLLQCSRQQRVRYRAGKHAGDACRKKCQRARRHRTCTRKYNAMKSALATNLNTMVFSNSSC